MKIKSLGSVLAKRFGVEAAQELVPWHPTLGDVDSPAALEDYQAAKRLHKNEWTKAKAGLETSAGAGGTSPWGVSSGLGPRPRTRCRRSPPAPPR